MATRAAKSDQKSMRVRLGLEKPELTRCFVPTGRSSHIIYAVQLREHPEIVKVGRTTKWSSRRISYANWNLSAGDGIHRDQTFTVTEEFVDLPALEEAILRAMPYPIRHGREWFRADFDEVCRFIDRFLREAGLSYC